jgi:hypothetical protein
MRRVLIRHASQVPVLVGIRVCWWKHGIIRSNVFALGLDKGGVKYKRIGNVRIVSSTKGFIVKMRLGIFSQSLNLIRFAHNWNNEMLEY